MTQRIFDIENEKDMADKDYIKTVEDWTKSLIEVGK
nr:MAG TPA: hypothetical protein [Siphoviridae sp. ctD5s5]